MSLHRPHVDADLLVLVVQGVALVLATVAIWWVATYGGGGVITQ